MIATVKIASLVVLLVCSNPGGVRAQPESKRARYFDENAWTLIRKENERLKSLKDLRDGVYSLELASSRSSCGSGPGMCFESPTD